MEKNIRAKSQQCALKNFRKLTPNKYIPVSAKRVSPSIYSVKYRLRKGEY